VAAAAEAPGYAALGQCLLAVIALRQGDAAAAAGRLSGQPTPVPYPAAMYARSAVSMSHALVAAADPDPAAAISRIRDICAGLPASPGVLLGEPGIPAWLVRTALTAGEASLAADVTQAAAVLARANPGVPGVTAAEDLGVLLAGQGRHDPAITQLTEAMAGYGRAGAVTDMARIRHRLRELGVRRRYWSSSPGRPVTGWESLTEAERATSKLAAQGLNNRQIGSRLYISRHTVAFHLRQIFRKLDISSRVELARIVMERGQLH
jgi:DNA-binding CsgD family transcriptional regulator